MSGGNRNIISETNTLSLIRSFVLKVSMPRDIIGSIIV